MARSTHTSEDEPQAPPAELTSEETKSTGAAGNAGIPSPTAGDELDEFAAYAVQDVITSQSGEVVTCSVGPPNRLHFYRTQKDALLYRDLHFLTIESDNKKRTYLVHGTLIDLPEFEGRTKVARTAPWINEHGGLGIWLPSIQHDENSWVRSALIAIERAKVEWIAAIPVKKFGAYTILPKSRDLGEPSWPKLDFAGWMNLAFPEDMRINNRDHPIAAKLRGE